MIAARQRYTFEDYLQLEAESPRKHESRPFDRTYQTIASVRDIVLVSQARREIEVIHREADGTWSRHLTTEGAARLVSIACELPIAEVYRDPLAGG